MAGLPAFQHTAFQINAFQCKGFVDPMWWASKKKHLLPGRYKRSGRRSPGIKAPTTWLRGG